MLPRSYTAHSLEFFIHGLRDSLNQDPNGPMANRYRAMLARAEAELAELKSLMGESNDKSVFGPNPRQGGGYDRSWVFQARHRRKARGLR